MGISRSIVNTWAVALTILALPVLAVPQETTAIGVRVFLFAALVSLVPVLSAGSDGWRSIRAAASSAAFAAFVGAVAVAFGFNPSTRGAMIGFFAIAGLGMALSVATFSVEQMGKFVVRPFLFVTGVQFALIVFQTVTGSPIGLTVFRPDAVLVVTNGGLVRPQGMYVHVYVAAAFALLCLAIALAVVPRLGAPSRWYLVGLASAAGTVAVTHSRSALLGFLIVAGIATGIAVRRAPLLRVATTVVGVAFVAAAAFTSDGWVARLDDSVTGDLDESSLGRITLVKQGLALARSSPLVGVGPGLYLEALADQDLVDEEFPYRVHSVPILLAAELGVVAAIVLTVVVGYAGFQAWRAGGEASMVFWSIVPLSMFDIVFYDRLNGLLLLGVWSGVCASMYLQNGKSGHREKWRRASAR